MENEAITEYGTGKTYQPGLCFIEERATTFPGDSTLNEAVWCVTNTGVSVCSASQRDQWGIGHTGSVCCIYCQNTTQPEHTCKETCKQSKDYYQQSSEYSAGRIFSKERSCPKKSDKLKYHSPSIGCGSKSSLRFTIFSSQPIIKLYQPDIRVMNK